MTEIKGGGSAIFALGAEDGQILGHGGLAAIGVLVHNAADHTRQTAPGAVLQREDFPSGVP